MKTTGIIRKVDQLGRIVIPRELRTTLDIQQETLLDICIDRDNIIIKKYEPGCIFCNGTVGIQEFCGKKICKFCIRKIADLSDIK